MAANSPIGVAGNVYYSSQASSKRQPLKMLLIHYGDSHAPAGSMQVPDAVFINDRAARVFPAFVEVRP